MKTLVIDDEHHAVDGLLSVLYEVDPNGVHKGFLIAEEALAYLQDCFVDVVFVDIEMPHKNGLELAREIKSRHPKTNIIFVTAYSEYALDAYRLHASGYLVKPPSKEMVLEELRHLRFSNDRKQSRLYVQCFGNFEVYTDGKPIVFKRNKTKELFAYLIDRRGASCTMAEIAAVLWEDLPATNSQKSQLRNLISDLRQALKTVGQEDIVIKSWNHLAVDTSSIDCDYYGFLYSDPASINLYQGEYMVQYSWAEMTTAQLSSQKR